MVPERAATDQWYPVLGQDQRLQAEQIREWLLLQLDDGVVVKPKANECRKIPERSFFDDGQVVVAQVEVLELRHVSEGAPDLYDRVVGDVQGGEVAQRVEGISW